MKLKMEIENYKKNKTKNEKLRRIDLKR